VGLFWGMMTVGCVLDVLLKVMDSKIVLRIFTLAALIILTFTLFGKVQYALFGYPALGFCLSVMYAVIFSLALNSVSNLTDPLPVSCARELRWCNSLIAYRKVERSYRLTGRDDCTLFNFSLYSESEFLAKPIVKNAIIKGRLQIKLKIQSDETKLNNSQRIPAWIFSFRAFLYLSLTISVLVGFMTCKSSGGQEASQWRQLFNGKTLQGETCGPGLCQSKMD